MKAGETDDRNNNTGGMKVTSTTITTVKTGTVVRRRDASTLFVRNIHPSITRLRLEGYFSDHGPVKKCSIVRPRGGNDGEGQQSRGSRLYGFVKFANEDDASRALDALRASRKDEGAAADGGGGDDAMFRGLIVEHADSNSSHAHASHHPGSHPHGRQQRPEGGGADEDVVMARRKRTSRVIVRNLAFRASAEDVRSVMAKYGEIVDVHLPLVPTLGAGDDREMKKGKGRRKKKQRQQQHRGFAFVTYDGVVGARGAVEACAEAASRGEGIEIKGRPVAIDFSVSKIQHDRMRKEEEEDGEGLEEEKEETAGDDEDDTSDDSDSDSGDDDDSGPDGSERDGGGVASSTKERSRSSSEGKDGEDSSGSSSSSVSASSSSDSDSNSDSDSDSDSDSTSSTTSSDVGRNEEGAEGSSPDKTQPNDPPPPPRPPPPDDVDQHRTIFVRNVPFDATRRSLFSTFRKYGRIDAAYLVKDRSTGRLCRGTAFVKFSEEKGCRAALEAGAAASDTAPFVSSYDSSVGGGAGATTGDGDGIFLSGRRLLVDLAVDRTTANQFAPVERDENGRAIKKHGKDRRNLYLKVEGHVDGDAWDDLPDMDRERRRRANSEKSSKLKSPTFFVNPQRLSVRNLAKHVTEVELRKLAVDATMRGLEGDGVTEEDVKAQLRANGLSPRECVGDAVKVPPFDVKNTKRYIPSVYIDRDKLAFEGGRAKKNHQTGASTPPPSKGFAFVEFTHHAHALACLRELNNNPRYSEDFATKGKQAAAEAAKSRGSGGTVSGGKKRGRPSLSGFVGEDGKVKVPRLIVEFAVENMVKAKQQAHRRAQQLANAEQQRLLAKKNKDGSNSRKKRGRGSIQREKKRQRKMAEAAEGTSESKVDTHPGSAVRSHISKDEVKSEESERTDLLQLGTKMMKKIKPPKRRKVDKEEIAFEEMVRSYKATFSGDKKQTGVGMQQSAAIEPSRARVAERRWFE